MANSIELWNHYSKHFGNEFSFQNQLSDMWVRDGGVAHINSSFVFDRKRNSVEVEIRQGSRLWIQSWTDVNQNMGSFITNKLKSVSNKNISLKNFLL